MTFTLQLAQEAARKLLVQKLSHFVVCCVVLYLMHTEGEFTRIQTVLKTKKRFFTMPQTYNTANQNLSNLPSNNICGRKVPELYFNEQFLLAELRVLLDVGSSASCISVFFVLLSAAGVV
jgi:hypothetical protein